MKSILTGLAVSCLCVPGVLAAHQAAGHGGPTIGHSGGRNGSAAHVPARANGYGSRRSGYFLPFFDYDYGFGPEMEPYASPQAAGYSSMMPAMMPSMPPAAIAPETAHSVIHEYTRPEDYGAPTDRDAVVRDSDADLNAGPLLYLIAFRDNSIRAAMTYWIEGSTLHYLDREHKAQQAPLAAVDRELSAQLNRERHVPFNLQ